MADKYKVYGKHYGITPSMAKAIVKIVENEINCNECLDIVTVGERPENVNFAIYFDTDEPASAVSGDVWVDTDNGSMYIYNGTTWTTGFRWDFENGITNDAGNVKLGGELIENTIITSSGETFQITYNPTGTDVWSVNLITPAPGYNMFVAGYADSASGGKNYKNVVALTDFVSIVAADDSDLEFSSATVKGDKAVLTYTDVSGSGADNSSVKASKGFVTIIAPETRIESETITVESIGSPTTIEFIKETNIQTEANGAGNTNGINIQVGTATNGNGGDIQIISGKSLISGNGGDIIVEPSTGVTATGNLIIKNLPTYADDAAAGLGGLTANTVYKTAGGELRIKL